jgi:hypothetical protein
LEGYHGQRKPRKYEGNFWTHRPRKGAFGRGIWKMWFNNAAMNRLEGRLRGGDVGNWRGRREQTRYSLRTLRPSEVDTSEARDTLPCEW